MLTETKTDTEHHFTVTDSDTDEMQGECKAWDSKGKLQKHCFYKDGLLHGECKWWDDNGELRHHSFHNKGNKVIDFLKNPELYPVTKDAKLMFVIKYGSSQWL